ncbi:probable ATP-dependent RNA helicase kurz [Anabrus simplex]|uniref:probable ATP-dependent RNA helicase kurz n=1 Tax=Anabrus simplex TaxID=316456 RepID=UPI0035A3B330
MGKNKKKGFNWKARQVVDTTIDDSKTKKISLELSDVRSDSYDKCNALVIPSQKRKTKKIIENVTKTRILSKRERKRLEKIVDQKKKKLNRAELLEALSHVQVPAEELSRMTSIAAMQTLGVKRMHSTPADDGGDSTEQGKSGRRISSVAGSSKRRRLLALSAKEEDRDETDKDPNVVGLEESSDESEDDDTEESPVVNGNGMSEEQPSVEEEEEEVKADDDDTPDPPAAVEKTTNDVVQVEVEEKKESAEVKTKETIKDRKPAIFVPVHRPAEVQEARLKLPILAEEQAIMEAIAENDVVVIAGETGSGKTTQLPQFLYEAGYASKKQIIGVTEPRRVAAVSMSRRVGHEMGLSEREVSYLIRFEGNTTEDTCIKFMTDGVLLKEIQSDFLLRRYSVIILDEAHERSVYTDILLGLLSRIVPLRARRGMPMKLLVMSATLRLEDFVDNPRLFPTSPPVIKVESRQFPVTIHFNKRTKEDYLTEAFSKTCKIHNQLPEGGILVFLTGQQEVNSLVRKLRKTFPYRKMTTQSKQGVQNGHAEEESDDDDDEPKGKSKRQRLAQVALPSIDLDEFPVVAEDNGDDDDDLALDDEDEDEELAAGGAALATRQPMWVLPLYSLLPGHEQAKVFQPPPVGCRLCVVATNVAETSLTIPGVRYVVDCGRSKVRKYDRVTGVSAFHVDWTSKASANQRAGRAGRTGPGHCYRLYSSAVFNDQFDDFSPPEIQVKPVDDLVLQMKAMGIHKVVNFPFPSPPGLLQLQAAERRLVLIGALEPPSGRDTEDWISRITPLGRAMASFPVAPRFAKMLALSHQHGLLPYTICMVAALTVPEVLIEGDVAWTRARRAWAGTGQSLLLGDPMVLLRAVGAAEHANAKGELTSFCQQHGLRHKAVVEVRKLRLQLTSEVNLAAPDIDLVVDPSMPPPSEAQARRLRQILLAGLADHVARRVDPEELKEEEDKVKWKHAYRCGDLEEPVRVHGSSVLRRELPQWVVYQEVFETQKLYMRGLTAIEPEWLPVYAPALCNLSSPLLEPPPRYDAATDQLLCHVSGSFGRAGWQLPVLEIDFPPGLDRYKWFAQFLLDGSVCPQLRQYKASLLSSPTTMTKSWANLQPRTQELLNTLRARQVDSRSKLLEAWKLDSTYLLAAYQKWLPESAHNEVALAWPPT